MRRSANRFSVFHTWKDHFTFTRRERKGIAILSLILLGQCAYLYYLNKFAAPPLPSDAATLQRKLVEAMNSRQPDEEHQGLQREPWKRTGSVVKTIAPFDPNRLDAAGWERLGLTAKQAGSVLKYLEKGGRFRVKSDLAKAYGIGVKRAKMLAPFLLLPDSLPDRVRQSAVYKRRELQLLELNGADSASLEALPGIGPGLAGRIVRYRDRLGGYHTLEQLKEVWGVDDSLYSFIVRRLTVDGSGLHRKLYLNTDSLERFGRHPYLGWKLGRILINYRKQHGPYQHVEELLKTGLIEEDIFRKLAPYLEVGYSE